MELFLSAISKWEVDTGIYTENNPYLENSWLLVTDIYQLNDIQSKHPPKHCNLGHVSNIYT